MPRRVCDDSGFANQGCAPPARSWLQRGWWAPACSRRAVRIRPRTAVARRDAAFCLLCGRGRQTPQPPPGSSGGASRPVRPEEARAGAGARGDQTSLQPSPARNRAGGWCDVSKARPRASSPLHPALTRWLARCGAVLGVPAPGDGLFPGRGVSLWDRAERWLSNTGWSSAPGLTCSGCLGDRFQSPVLIFVSICSQIFIFIFVVFLLFFFWWECHF